MGCSLLVIYPTGGEVVCALAIREELRFCQLVPMCAPARCWPGFREIYMRNLRRATKGDIFRGGHGLLSSSTELQPVSFTASAVMRILVFS